MNFDIRFKSTTYEELKNEVSQHAKKNNMLIDSYFEYFIMTSNFYEIRSNDKVVGFFSVLNKNSLTFFKVYDEYNRYAQEIFFLVKKMEKVKDALVFSSDELFLNLCMDSYSAIDKHGYCTVFPTKQKPLAHDIMFTKATIDELPALLEMQKGDILYEDLTEQIKYEAVYKILYKNSLIGYGLYEVGNIRTDCVSFGMYVGHEYRGKGFSKDILMWMNNKAIGEGLTAIAGCEYCNHSSLKAQLSSGAICKTRTYKISF